MNYEEKMIDGVLMFSYQGGWYPLYENEHEYQEKVEDGMVMVCVDGSWYSVTEAVQDQFPFYDLENEELHELFHDPPHNPLDYEDDDEEYDMRLIE